MPANKVIVKRKDLMEAVKDRLRAGSAGAFQVDPTDAKGLRELRSTVRGAVGRLDSLIELAEAPVTAPKGT